MNKREVGRFFKILGALYPEKGTVFVTGAAAGAFYGRVRPTADIDFALRLGRKAAAAKEEAWSAFTNAVAEARARTGIDVQYAEDIDRWSSITLLDYDRHTRAVGRFGKLEERLLEPAYWAIGKLSRYLDSDVRDLVIVFRRTRTSWRKLAPLLGKALRKRPKSTACFSFRRQVEDFLKIHGKEIWGKNYSAQEAIALFHRHAKIT